MLTDTQITKFQKIYQQEFGRKISRKEALDKGIKLVRLMEIVYKPISKKDYQELQERRKETK